MQWFVVLQGVFLFKKFASIVELVAGSVACTDGASGVAAEGSFFKSLFNTLVKEGEIVASLCAGVN